MGHTSAGHGFVHMCFGLVCQMSICVYLYAYRNLSYVCGQSIWPPFMISGEFRQEKGKETN